MAQGGTEKMTRRNQIWACFEDRFTNGLAVEYDMKSRVTENQGSGLSHWKDELAIDLDGQDHRGAGWEEVEELIQERRS